MIKQNFNLCYHAHCGVKSNIFVLYTFRGNSGVIYQVQLSVNLGLFGMEMK